MSQEGDTKIEYRAWNPFRSKLAAAILGGVDQIHIKPGSKVMYLGAASGTTVSHVSDIVGPVRIKLILFLNKCRRYICWLCYMIIHRPCHTKVSAESKWRLTMMSREAAVHVCCVYGTCISYAPINVHDTSCCCCCCKQEGLVYAVEFSHRSGRDLLNVAKKRTNIIPIIEDARHPHKYRMLVGK